ARRSHHRLVATRLEEARQREPLGDVLVHEPALVEIRERVLDVVPDRESSTHAGGPRAYADRTVASEDLRNPSPADSSAADWRACFALSCSACSDRRQIGPEMPIAPATRPAKSYTGTATQRSSASNSPSSNAMPRLRTSSSSRRNASRPTRVLGVKRRISIP